jgi:hypothetical protein
MVIENLNAAVTTAEGAIANGGKSQLELYIEAQEK